MCVCVCVCVRERERERDIENPTTRSVQSVYHYVNQALFTNQFSGNTVLLISEAISIRRTSACSVLDTTVNPAYTGYFGATFYYTSLACTNCLFFCWPTNR